MTFDVPALLASSDLFADLDAGDIGKLASQVRLIRVPGGQVLFHQGDPADCLYVVGSGRLRAIIDHADGTEEVLGDVGRGEVVGEMALLIGEPRSATVRVVRDSHLIRLDKAAFDALVEHHPSTVMQITRRLVTRYRAVLRSRSGGTVGRLTTVALVPTSTDVPLAAFVDRLERALAATTTVLRLNSTRVDSLVGPGASQTAEDHGQSSDLAVWLSHQEAGDALVLYEADRQPTAWTRRCIRQADRVILVGSDQTDPAPGPNEVAIRREGIDPSAISQELVLLHPAPKPLYSGTAAWLAPRHLGRHHHIVLDSDADIARFVRMLTGSATALVFGGGGARSFAQIGVLKAMAELSIPIDLIGGTSMGAYLAAQHALGWDVPRMLDFNTRLWGKEKPLKDYTLPFVGLVKGQRFLRQTRATYGEAHIEDLGLPFFCCSSNITTARVMVHDRGLIWRLLSASIAVPGISPPLFERGELLVDGAVLDNLPVEVMRRRTPGAVIAVDVSPEEDLRADPDYSMCPPSWRILANRMNPFGQRMNVPSIFEILSRCASLGSLQQREAMKLVADLYLHPPTESFSMFAWQSVRELADVGYRSSLEPLSAWAGKRGAAGRAAAAPAS